MGSCASTKNVAYFKNKDYVDLEPSRMLYDARIMPKDLLSITVNTTEADAAAPFNLTTTSGGSGVSEGGGSMQSYLVDNDGNIEFPRIGTIHLAGLTKSEAEKLVLEKIKPFMNAAETPLVTVRMANYKISVLGEVGNPGMYTVSNEKITVLEALAQAGDLTIYGKRDNVMLIREDATGQKSIHTFNLNDTRLLNSPYYYLQQNDIVYVEPNKVKAQNSNVGSMTTLWLTVLSTTISIASLVINILR